MERKDHEAPFPREPWKRLLEDSAALPPETTDARIRAAARRDLAPRGRRWWLPASLAASLLLAVMIVHSQFGTIRRAPMTESDRSGGPAMDARLIDRNEGPEAREAGEAPAAPARRPAPAREEAEAGDYGYLDPETGSDLAGVGPRVGGPEHELKAASELPGEAADSAEPAEVVTTGSRRRESPSPQAPPVSAISSTAEAARPAAAADDQGLVTPPTPEAWYAAIEKLRAEGRLEEAERELERLEKAYPGWLEAHLEKQAR
jgi:hypothetical protein